MSYSFYYVLFPGQDALAFHVNEKKTVQTTAETTVAIIPGDIFRRAGLDELFRETITDQADPTELEDPSWHLKLVQVRIAVSPTSLFL
jgi:hypothetical protein